MMAKALRTQNEVTAVSGDAEDSAEAERARQAAELDRKLAKRAKRDAIAAIVIFIVAVIVVSFPFVTRAISSYRQRSIVNQSKTAVDDWPYPQAKEHLKAAREYNRRLYRNGQSAIGEVVDPFQKSGESQDDSLAAQDKEYQSLLDTGQGVMGVIRIPKISVNLPIFHGTGEVALSKGTGHLYGTSLPVGGKNTHSVITGHRGMVTAEMFTRLDELKKGDAFYIDVMGETLGYKVDSIKVILPTEGTKYLRVHQGEDRVTLMTCTPYGVNTHRLLVSGVRTPLSELTDQHDSAIYRDVMVGVVAIVAIIAIVVVARRQSWLPVRHATNRRNL